MSLDSLRGSGTGGRGFAECNVEELVLVLVDQVERGGTEDVAEEFVAALGDLVLGGEEESFVVGGPGEGGDALGGVGESDSGARSFTWSAYCRKPT